MINIRGWAVVGLWTVALISLAAAKGNAQPDKPTWSVDCNAIRQIVALYGVAAATSAARSAGVPERAIAQAKACLKKG